MEIKTPLKDDVLERLRAGDRFFICGIIYTARDAAHARLFELLEKGEETPFPLEGQVIYYTGPAPAKAGRVIGSAGPTTSYRMDPYAIFLFEKNAKISIGKGDRSQEFKDKLKQHQGLYLSAIGGAAALISRSIKKCDLVAYPDLGAEAIYRLEVEDFPAIVAYDAHGGDLFESGRTLYRK